MKTLSILAALVLAGGICAQDSRATDEKRMTVVDYFLLLPPKYFEATPADWLSFLRQPKCGVVDLANGYMSCTGDGAQPEFEVALFRYRDGRPLLAICQGELEGPDSVYPEFFEPGADSKMHKMKRSIFPVADSVTFDKSGGRTERGNWRFELPRRGKTVLVRDQRSGKILRKLTWNGERFQDEK